LLSLGMPRTDLDQPLEAVHVNSRFNLASPISGTVVERSLTLGQVVGGDNPAKLFVVADLDTLWVTVDIYEKHLPLVHPGEDVTLEAGAWPGQEFHGQIGYVADTVDPNSRTIKVRATVDNRQGLLKPEMFMTATVQAPGSTTVLTVPVAAIHGEGS